MSVKLVLTNLLLTACEPKSRKEQTFNEQKFNKQQKSEDSINNKDSTNNKP